MYAVIKAGGKQHKVKAGDVIEVELMRGVGDTVTFQPLLVVDDDGKTHVGKDVAKAVVTARPAGEQKGDKVRVFKYKAKTGYARKAGHRQLMTLLEIAEVKLGASSRSSSSAKASTGSTKPSASDEEPAGTGAARKRPSARAAASSRASEEAQATETEAATE